jgi:hypothetical protein
MGVGPTTCEFPSTSLPCVHVSRQKKTRHPDLARESSVERKLLPRFDYYLDESDPDIMVLRRQDDTFVAAFSAQGATREGIAEAAKEDYQQLMEATAGTPVLREDGHQERSA